LIGDIRIEAENIGDYFPQETCLFLRTVH
jgi:hypothetical protein